MKDIFTCYFPKVEFGSGKINKIGDIATRYGKKAFLAIDPFLESSNIADKIVKLLEDTNINTIVYSDIKPNPSCFSVDEAAKICTDERCDMIIAMGGGSAMDFGKAVSVVAKNGRTSWEYTERADHDIKRPNYALPIIAVPTTSGTGSETTPFSVLNNPSLKEKSTIVSDYIFPSAVLIDPDLTLSMPPRLTASTGFDAFAHALESYMSLSATPFSRIMAKEAMCTAVKHLPTAVKYGSDKAARAGMSWAAALGGASIAYVGVTLPHSLGQPVGGMFGAPHGESVAACIVEVIKRSAVQSPEIFADVSEILCPEAANLPTKEKAAICHELIENFLESINLKVKFSDFSMTERDIDRAVQIAQTGYYFDIQCHPHKVTESEIRDIYTKCL